MSYLDSLCAKFGHSLYLQYDTYLEDFGVPSNAMRQIKNVEFVSAFSSAERLQFSTATAAGGRTLLPPFLASPQAGAIFYVNSTSDAYGSFNNAGQVKAPWMFQQTNKWVRLAYQYMTQSGTGGPYAIRMWGPARSLVGQEGIVLVNNKRMYALTTGGTTGVLDTSGPTGTGSGIVEGSCTWDYVGDTTYLPIPARQASHDYGASPVSTVVMGTGNTLLTLLTPGVSAAGVGPTAASFNTPYTDGTAVWRKGGLYDRPGGGVPPGIGNMDGLARMWFDDTLIVAVGAAYLNVVVPGGVDTGTIHPPRWCDENVLGQIPIDNAVNVVRFSSVNSSTQVPWKSRMANIRFWRD